MYLYTFLLYSQYLIIDLTIIKMKLTILYQQSMMAIIKFLLLLLIILSSSCMSSFFMDTFVYPKWIGYLFCLGILLVSSSYSIIKNSSVSIKISRIELMVIIFTVILQILIYSFDVLLIVTSCVCLYYFFKVFINDISQEKMDMFLIFASFFPIYLATIQFCKSFQTINGTYDNPAGLSFSMILTIISLSNLITKSSTKRYVTLLYMLLIIICASVVFICNSRAGLLSIFVVIYIFFAKKYRKTVPLVFCGLVLFATFYYKTESSKGRWFIYSTSLSMLDTPRHICFGYGHDGFRKYYMICQAINLKGKSLEVRQRADNIRHPLNEFLLLLINYGGLFVLLLVLGLVVLSINASFDRAHLAFFSALLIFSFVSYPFRYPITWVALAWYTASLDYKFSKTIYIPMPIAIVTFLFSGVFICLYTVKNVKLHIRWASAYNNSLLGRYEKAEKEYCYLSQKLYNIPEFIYNYASFLEKRNKPNEALLLINNCYFIDYQTQMLKGSLFLDIKKYNIAFQHFKLAHEMCPNRFAPLYEMYIILGKVSAKGVQSKLGKLIIKKTIKIPSYEINEIKRKINKELNITNYEKNQ